MSPNLYEPSARGPFTATEIEELEQTLGCKLPVDYAEFVRTLGPVRFPSPRVTFDVVWQRVDGKAMDADEDEDFEDDFMLMILSDFENIQEHIRFLHGAYSKDGTSFIDKSLFPFSSDVDRGFLLMSLAEETYGKVYIYFPGDDPWGTGNNNYLGYVAGSFTDFIENKIRPYE